LTLDTQSQKAKEKRMSLTNQSVQEAFWTEREVAARLKISSRTLRRWIASQQAPPAIRLGGRTVRWRESDLLRYVEECRLNTLKPDQAEAVCAHEHDSVATEPDVTGSHSNEPLVAASL
jgi:excisionase family DNA binding protein